MNYKDYFEEYVGVSSESSTLIYRGIGGETGEITFGGPRAYSAYIVDQDVDAIPDHYHLIAEGDGWLTISDDLGRSWSCGYDYRDYHQMPEHWSIYRAANYGMIIKLDYARYLYSRDTEEGEEIRRTPFPGATRFEVMTYDEMARAIRTYFLAQDKYDDVDAMLQSIMQAGEGDPPITGSEYDCTWFDPEYCSQDERDLRAVFGGSRIHRYNPLTWDEDGEIDYDNTKASYYTVD